MEARAEAFSDKVETRKVKGEMKKKVIKEEFVTINGIEQYFMHSTASSDKLVLYLHGGPGLSESFWGHSLLLKQPYCNFVSYDQRGTGKTQAKNKTEARMIRMGFVMNDLRATVDYLKEKYEGAKIILVGHSWGSVLGLEYAKLFSNTISAYVGVSQVVHFKRGNELGFDKLGEMIDPSTNPKDFRKYMALMQKREIMSMDELIRNFKKIRRFQLNYGYDKRGIDLLKEVIKSPLFRLSDIGTYFSRLKDNSNLLDFLFRYDTMDYPYHNIPIYFICGEYDCMAPSHLVEEYYNVIEAPYKEIVHIANAGHSPHRENPIEFHKVLSRICNSI